MAEIIEQALQTYGETELCPIDEAGPFRVAKPVSVAELGMWVHRATAEKQALYPIGGRTLLHLGYPPTRPGVAVDLGGLSQVIDYPARDMTVTVQAGITIARLQELLRAENQRLPIDVPFADRATLGGAIATNSSGPHRYGFGTLRDYVIGLSAINDEGVEVKAGGRVVKNVAGYDLCKLYIGSLGTLGIITQITLKLRPLPAAEAVLTTGCSTEMLPHLLDQLHQSRTRPCCIELLSGMAARAIEHGSGVDLPDTPWVIVVGFEDNHEAVRWQMQQFAQEQSAVSGEKASHPYPLLLEEGEGGRGRAAKLWQTLTDFLLYPEARLTFKANVPPSATAAFCRKAATLPEALLLQAHADSGIVIGHAVGDLTLERASAMLTTLQAAAATVQGNIVVVRCPAVWKRSLPIWGVQRGDAWLMRNLKEKLDPRGLFNPGRFLDGL